MAPREINCTGCASRFAMKIGANAPLRARIACPRCGEPILLERTDPTNSPGQTADPARSLSPPSPRSTADTTSTPDPIAQPKSWNAIGRTQVFGSLTPAPPPRSNAPKPPREDRFQAPTPPKLGLFSGPSPEIDRHRQRSPEADRPETIRPLASALLRELQERRSAPAPPSEPAPQTDFRHASSRPSPVHSTASDDAWLLHALDQATEDAADELFLVDDSPLPSQRLPRPDESTSRHFFASSTASDSSAQPPFSTASVPPPIPSPSADVPDAVPAPAPPIDSLPTAAPFQTFPEDPPSDDDPTEDTTPPVPTPKIKPHRDPNTRESSPADDHPQYRLKVGNKVYAGITFQGLLELFRRGGWILATEVAEDDGPWINVEEHPVYHRIRRAISESLTDLLQQHAARIEDIRVEPHAPALLDRAAVPAIQQASHTLPWSIALISTGVASALTGAIVTYAFLGAPAPGTQAANLRDPGAETILTAPVVDDTARHLDEAVLFATELVTTAAAPSGLALATEALTLGNHDLARKLAAYHLPTSSDRFPLQELFSESVNTDPALREATTTLRPDEEIDLIRALGGGSSVLFRLTDDGTSRYSFKANRVEWEEAHRTEVAAFRLCQLIPCLFDIPITREARISRDDFNELYSRLNTPRQQSYAQRFDELIWTPEAGPDGITRDYLYGALKDWAPGFTEFPIEYTRHWRPYLDITASPSELDTSFNDYLQTLESYQDGRFVRGLREHYKHPTLRPLAHQISNLTVFDYLTNNFDRHSGILEYHGTNAHFANNRFLSLDNGAAFQFRPRSVMERRLAMITRFDRTLIEAIRLLRPEDVNPILFPQTSAAEEVRLRTFWNQRDKLLEYIDQLVDEYGEDAVFIF